MSLHRRVNKEIREREEEMTGQNWSSSASYCPNAQSPLTEWQDKLSSLRFDNIHQLEDNCDLDSLKVLRDAYLRVAKQYFQSKSVDDGGNENGK